MHARHRTRSTPPRGESLLHDQVSLTDRLIVADDGACITSFGEHDHSLSPIRPDSPRAATLDTSLLSPVMKYSEARSPNIHEMSSMFNSPSFLTQSHPPYDPLIARNSRRGLFEDTVGPSYIRQTTREERLRMLRHDAQRQHLKHAASFFAEKLMAKTDDINDVYCLADSYYQTQQYERALDLLNKKETLNKSVQCRYMAGLCAIALENWRDALDYLGHDNPFADKDFQHNHIGDGSVKLEAIMCYARGNAYLQLKEIEKAKKCFKEALSVDVKCYDALEALVQYNLLEERAEWEFIITLPYEEQCGQDSEFFRSQYMLKLKRYSHTGDIASAQEKIEQEYGLKNSLDTMQSAAETLLGESKFAACLAICQEIRTQDALYTKCIPTYLTCLYELDMKTELYEFAQELVDRLNDEAVTWHAVGMYYLYIKRYPEARRYFSQATTMDQYFEAAWLGFGHAFAAEKDHDQAIAAYMSCSKLIPGSHLPYMYIGMQYMEQNVMDHAYEYLIKSLNKCGNDPFLLNEFGVYYYNTEEYQRALEYIRRALRLAKDRQSPSSPIWEKIWINLGHVYRQLENYERALKCFRFALGKNPQNSDVHAAIGLIHHIQQKYGRAIGEYNTALKNSSTENIVIDLLEKALESNRDQPFSSIMNRRPMTDDEQDIFKFATQSGPRGHYVDDELTELEYEVLKESEEGDDAIEDDEEEGRSRRIEETRELLLHADSYLASDDGLLVDEGDLRPNMSREWL